MSGTVLGYVVAAAVAAGVSLAITLPPLLRQRRTLKRLRALRGG